VDGPIHHTIERGSRKFVFLRGSEIPSFSQITTIFEPAIEMVLADSPPPPAGEYYLAGPAGSKNLFEMPAHDVPSGAACECGVTAAGQQGRWDAIWADIGLAPRDNLILHNLTGINNRVVEIRSQGGSESDAQFVIAAALVHELRHVKDHQRMLCDWRGEAQAFEDQCDFMTRTAAMYGVHPDFLDAEIRRCRKTEREYEIEWRKRHPSWRA